MQYLDKAKIRFFDSINVTYKFLVNQYQQAKQVMTPASPYMQIITVLHNIAQVMLSYLEDAITESNILKARKPDSIRGLIQLSGHNPTRANCSKGEIKFKIRADKMNDIPGSFMIIPNNQVIVCKNNKKKYTVQFNKDRMIVNSNNLDFIYASIIQGTYDKQIFIGDGNKYQSFSVQPKKTLYIDDQNVSVYVNGVLQPQYDFISDIPYNANGCLIRTGLNGGIDVFFGNKSFGTIPQDGSIIEINYLETDGLSGNIYDNIESVVFDWQELINDNLGNDIDINEFFTTQLNTQIIFGSNSEILQFSKLVAPNASRTNVLGNPDSYIYYFQKMNLFSVVDAYTTFDENYLTDNHIIYLYLIPDVSRRLEENNYFKIPTTSFLLEDTEKTTLLTNIRNSKKMIPGSELQIVDPIIKKYVVNVALRIFEGFDENSIKAEILSKLSEYFLTIKRRDKIPRSDLVRIIEKMDGVDSVYVEFMSADNEIAMAKGYYILNTIDSTGTKTSKVTLGANENPLLGLDQFGDIVIQKGEIALIRGDFYDSNENYYTEYYEPNKTGPLNILINEVIPKDLYYDILNAKLENL